MQRQAAMCQMASLGAFQQERQHNNRRLRINTVGQVRWHMNLGIGTRIDHIGSQRHLRFALDEIHDSRRG